MRYKFLMTFAFGVLVAILVDLCFRMVAPFEEGAIEMLLIGLGIGLLIGIVLTIWVVRKVEAPLEEERKSKA